MGLGQDMTLVYERKEVVVDPSKFLFMDEGYDNVVYRVHPWRYDFINGLEVNALGFCGNVYPIIKIISRSGDVCCYSLDDVDHWIEAHCTEKQKVVYYGSEKWNKDKFDLYQKPIKKLFEYFDRETPKFKKIAEGLHVASKTPMFLNVCDTGRPRTHKLIYNCNLKELQFFKIKDTFTAYQDISQYIGGVLGQANKPIPEISNQDMRDAKGFNEWSFKKEPSKKK